MSNNSSDHSIKPVRHSRTLKCRLKAPTVRNLNGSNSTFRRFYQSGGRDYEQYRLWLQSLSKSEQISTPSDPSIDSVKIKEEPLDMRTNVVSRLSPSLSVHSQQPPLSKTKIIHTHPLLNPERHLSIPIKSQLSLPLRTSSSSLSPTTSFESQIHASYHRSHIPIVPMYYPASSSLISWSIADVGQFIEKHFAEKNIARKFIQQKIDGSALPLLTEDHLTRIFKMKLGPALHLLALISNTQIQN